MPEERFDLRDVDVREVLPWVHLFRGFRIALDWKKIVLGAAGAVLTAFGWWAIGGIATGRAPAEPDALAAEATPVQEDEYNRQRDNYALQLQHYDALQETLRYEVRRFPWQPHLGSADRSWPDVYRSPLQQDGLLERGLPIPKAGLLVLEPVRRLISPAVLMVQSPGSTLTGALLLIWAAAVWAFFGGGITRIAAVQFARDMPVGLLGALRFVANRYLHYLGAPLLPLAGLLVLVVLCAIGGAIAQIPLFDVLAGLVWVLPLLAGIVMVIALVGLAVGWPLMYSAISAEATESIDAVSRSFSYVLFGRPWHYLFYSVVALVYGAILTTFVVSIGFGIVDQSQYAVSWGWFWGDESAFKSLFAYVPGAGGWRDAFGAPGSDSEPTGTRFLAALVIGLWTHALFLAIVGFAYSYFWSSATIIYFLLRSAVDETELGEVYLEEEEEEPFPTVSAAAPTGPPPGGAVEAGGPLPVVEPPPGD